jgi:integrase
LEGTPVAHPTTRLPKLRHQKSRDLAVVRIDGKDHYLGKFGSPESVEKYHRVVGEWMVRGADVSAPEKGSPVTTPNPTVSELTLAYYNHAVLYYQKSDGSPGSEVAKIKLVVRPLRALYGSTFARDFGPVALKAVRQSMVDAGLARRTVNQRTARIVRLFGHAVENELIPASIHHALKAVSGLRAGRSGARESKVVRPVADTVVEAVRPFVSRQVWAMIELQRLTGMRSGEVTIMRSADIDTTGSVWTYTPSSHKTAHHGHARSIYLGPKAQTIVKPWLRLDLDAFLFQPREAVEEARSGWRAARRTPMTPSQRARKRKPKPVRVPGERYDSGAYGHAIGKGCDRAFRHPTLGSISLKDLTHEQTLELRAWQRSHRWHPHQLRHGAATHLRKSFGLDVARVVLGHRSAGVTDGYAELDRGKAIEAMESVG